jgi:hypothetical protein
MLIIVGFVADCVAESCTVTRGVADAELQNMPLSLPNPDLIVVLLGVPAVTLK